MEAVISRRLDGGGSAEDITFVSPLSSGNPLKTQHSAALRKMAYRKTGIIMTIISSAAWCVYLCVWTIRMSFTIGLHVQNIILIPFTYSRWVLCILWMHQPANYNHLSS